MDSPDPNKHTVIVVDDSPTVRRVLSRTLERADYEVFTVESAQEAMDICLEGNLSLMVIDELLLDSTGPELIERVRKEAHSDLPLVLTTSRSAPLEDGVEDGPDVHHLPKPFSPKELVSLIDGLLKYAPAAVRLRLVDADAETAAAEDESFAVGEFEDLVREASESSGAPAQAQPVGNPEPPAPEEGPPAENRRRRRRPDADDITEQLDRLLRKHLEKRIPAIVKGALYDTLRETGLVAHSTVQVSGTLDALGLPEVLGFVETVALTGRLAVLCKDSFGEVWCDQGRFVFASATRPVAGSFLAKLLKDVAGEHVDANAIRQAIQEAEESERRIGEVLREKELLDDEQLETLLQHQALESFAALLELSEGMFHFEAMDVPERMSDITSRMPLRSVLMDGLRLLDEKLKAERTLGDDSILLAKAMNEEQAHESFKFTPAELELFDVVDGVLTLGDLLDLSPLTGLETKRVFARLQRVGLLRTRTAA